MSLCIMYSQAMEGKWIAILRVIVKYFQPTIGSAFMLVLAWLVAFGKMSTTVAFEVALLLAIGGYVSNNKIDSIIKYLEHRYRKEDKDAE